MIKGHTYDEQVYDSYAHRMLNRAFMDNKSGIVRDQGSACEVTYTARNLTVSDGYIIVQGGITEINSDETLELELDDSYCRLVYEIDMTKTNDDTNFNQGSLKIIKSSSDYPTLIQNTLTKNSGIYQFELAQFKASLSGISNFIDKRSYIDYGDTLEWIKDELGTSDTTYSNTQTYSLNDIVIYNNKTYKCIIPINIPENFDSTKWELVPIIKNHTINYDLISWKFHNSVSNTTISNLPQKFNELFIAVKRTGTSRTVYLAQTIIPYSLLDDDTVEINIGGRLTLPNQGSGAIGQISKTTYQTSACYLSGESINSYETEIYYR